MRLDYCLPFSRLPSSLRLGTVTLLVALWAVSQARSEDEKSRQQPTPKGQRVFTCGHSFHVFVYPILAEMAKSAGIQDHESVGLSAIGGSRVIQHWDVPEEKNQAKAALRAGKVDVLTLSPIWMPDEGIEKLARLVRSITRTFASPSKSSGCRTTPTSQSIPWMRARRWTTTPQ